MYGLAFGCRSIAFIGLRITLGQKLSGNTLHSLGYYNLLRTLFANRLRSKRGCACLTQIFVQFTVRQNKQKPAANGHGPLAARTIERRGVKITVLRLHGSGPHVSFLIRIKAFTYAPDARIRPCFPAPYPFCGARATF